MSLFNASELHLPKLVLLQPAMVNACHSHQHVTRLAHCQHAHVAWIMNVQHVVPL